MHNNGIINLLIALLFFFVSSQSATANDSAAGLAATGIYLKQEKNISIEEEVLYINEDKVDVSYVFKNHSDNDISTEVAFPMPDYEWDISGNGIPYPMYDDFTVEINGTRIIHQEEIRAFVKNKDLTRLLNAMELSIRDFADFDSFFFRKDRFNDKNRPKYFYQQLTPNQQQILIKNELVYLQVTTLGELALPAWRVSRKYYWTQVFPANSTISIKHTYKPYKGFDYIGGIKSIDNACMNSDDDFKRRLAEFANGPKYFTYVDYILTTANNWRQPIKSFHLIIDGHGSNYNKAATMCFERKLKKTGPSRYEVIIPNYKPQKDISVYFF